MNKIEYIEFYVSDLANTVLFYQDSLQFIPVAYLNQQEQSSVLLCHGDIKIMLTATSRKDNAIARHIEMHGDGIKEIVFQSDDVDKQFQLAINNQSQPVLFPTEFVISGKRVRKATVTAYGDMHYTFIEKAGLNQNYLPNFVWHNNVAASVSPKLSAIDHIAICVEKGSLQRWIEYHKQVFDLVQSYEEYVSTDNSSMQSVVVESYHGELKFVILEAGDGQHQSQVDSFICQYSGAGVQHIAFSSNDIVQAVQHWNSAGVKFLEIPDSYYEIIKDKIYLEERQFDLIKRLSILIDSNETGCLYQIFTKPIVTRQTIFFEIIQRVGDLKFAGGNINALFKAIEQEQLKRAANCSNTDA